MSLPWPARRAARWLGPLLVVVLSGSGLAACGGGGSGTGNSGGATATRSSGAQAAVHAAPHPFRVVASAFPLAQLVSYIGGPDVSVTDLVPPGAQPEATALSARQHHEIASAQFVVDVGDGYQPEVEASAASRPHFAVLPSVSKQAQPYEIWLDPYLWSSAATALTKAMKAADPGGARQFQNGLSDFQSLASSVASDYVSTLSECPLRELVTADDAFGRMANAFSLVDVPLSTTGVKKALAVIAQYSLPDVFSEQGVGSGEISRLAHTARVGLKSLDPMELTPQPGTEYQSYFAIMESNLSALEGPLECDTSMND